MYWNVQTKIDFEDFRLVVEDSNSKQLNTKISKVEINIENEKEKVLRFHVQFSKIFSNILKSQVLDIPLSILKGNLDRKKENDIPQLTVDYILPSSKLTISDALINWGLALDIPKVEGNQKKKKNTIKKMHVAFYITYQNICVTLDSNDETLSTVLLEFVEIIVKDISNDLRNHYSLDLNLKGLSVFVPDET
jgi:ribosomal silencing factor RsfS